MQLGRTQALLHGVRRDSNTRYMLFRAWEFDDRIYEVSFYLVTARVGDECETRVRRTHYYAVAIDELMQLMAQAGFPHMMRIDDRFFQPVIVGMKR
jgi:hypothetical protein